MNLNQEVSDYIQKATEEQVELIQILRDLIHNSVDGVSENLKWGFPVFAKSKLNKRNQGNSQGTEEIYRKGTS